MSNLEIRSLDGKVVGTHELAKVIADTQPRKDMLHRAVVTEEANKRQGTQSAKTRGEVRGGGRKPYRQKKTGNARQGSIRSPHYAHGGMALAVKPRGYEKGLNRKERRAAIVQAFAAKVGAEQVVVVDKIAFATPKTKDALALLKSIGADQTRRVLVVLPEVDDTTYKCFRNLPNVTVRTAPANGEGARTATFSVRDLLVAHKVVIAQDALKRVEEFWGS